MINSFRRLAIINISGVLSFFDFVGVKVCRHVVIKHCLSLSMSG